MANKSVAIIGYGVVGSAYHKMFPDAVIYDEPKKFFHRDWNYNVHGNINSNNESRAVDISEARSWVNSCDVAIVAVWTGLNDKGELDTSIVEEVVGWIECPLILVKSALQVGTVDKLVKKTGKSIAVSVELIGEGKYYLPDHKYPSSTDPTKHQLLIVGGETKVAEACAEILWDRMSPDTRIHIVTAIEAEITKLAENAYGAAKVTWANVLRDVCDKYGASFIRVHQAWSEDGRTDPMHTRSVSFKRGWSSRCYDKDVEAFANISDSNMFKGLIEDNKRHLGLNEE